MSVRKEVSPLGVPCSSGNVTEQFLVADWDPLHAMEHSPRFTSVNGPSSYNGGSSNSTAIERMPSVPCFGSESFSEIMNSFTLPVSGQMVTALCSQDFPSTNELVTEKNVQGKKRKKLPESGALQSYSPPNVEAEQQKDVPIGSVKNIMEKDEKKQKNEVNTGVKDINGDSSKEDYIHMRAKRGQATNSHSLAERVRREKISERMRLLQDIVPGCNKITGKAVMLDEIINYVQSLQKQVEFLSMKLATVIPETNLDIEHIFTKENLHSLRYGSSFAYGYGPELGTSHSHSQSEIGIPSVSNSRDMLRTAIPQTSMPQISSSWDHEFQNAFQMGFIPNLHGNEAEMNGSMKLEL